MFNIPNIQIEMNCAIGKAITVLNNDGIFDFSIDLSKLDSKKFKTEDMATIRRGQAIQSYSLFKAYEKGLKVFKINNLDFNALEQMNLSLTMEDYNQPYVCMVIVPPKEYRDNKINRQKKISFVTIIHELNFLIITAFYENNTTNTTVIQEKRKLLEDCFHPDYVHKGWDSTQDRLIEADEAQYLRDIVKSCLNAILIIDEIGQKGLKKTERKGQIKGQRETIFEFNQTVKLFDQYNEYNVNQHEHGGGWTVTPHWRRGHWRIQHFGVGNKEKKRVRIKPVLVNKEFFGGDLSKTSSEYLS